MKLDSAKKVMSGTWSEIWLDGEQVGEAYGFQAKISANKEKIELCGQMWTDHKVMSIEGTGSLRMHKVNSRMTLLLGEALAKGQDPRFTIVEKQADPDADGVERIALTGVSFDDLTLADWEAGQVGKVECPFTFSGYKTLDTIQPRA